MIMIDGSLGEGGGQILRSSLALSMVTGKPFAIENIRAGRAKPGMMRQHLTAVKAAAAICDAQLRHAEIGSTRLVFEPGAVKAGDYSFNIGSAGSTTLVLQTVLLPLALAGASSRLTIQGGTHNIAAPPFEFINHAFLPLLRRMGFSVAAQLVRPGFYPAGGGEITVEIKACEPLKPLVLETRGAPVSRKIEAFVAGLPFTIAKREVAHAGSLLGWPEADGHPRAFDGAHGPGNAVSVHVEHENVTEVFVGFGRHGVSSEAVAAEAVREASTYLAGAHPVGPHLADQLLLPLVLAAGGCFVTGPLSEHTRTNIAVIQRFLTASILVVPMVEGGAVRIAVEQDGPIGVK